MRRARIGHLAPVASSRGGGGPSERVLGPRGVCYSPRVRIVSAMAWAVVNTLQYAWFGAYSFVCFLVSFVIYAVTWNAESALAIGRVIYAPVNWRVGLSSVLVEGRENIPARGPFLLMMNHQSMVDIPLAWHICPVAVRFISKKAIAYFPVFGWALWLYGMVWLSRGDAREALRAIKKAAGILQRGDVVCAYPEGTRSRDGRIAPFKQGVFLLAVKAGVPILPVAIDGAGVLAPAKGFSPRPVNVRVRVGAPIPTTGKRRDALLREVRDVIIDMHLAIGGQGGDKETPIADEAAPSGARAPVPA